VAHACNPVTWRLGSLNGLRAGFLRVFVLCRSGVRAKFGVNKLKTIYVQAKEIAHQVVHATRSVTFPKNLR